MTPITIVAADFNKDIVNPMIEAALQATEALGYPTPTLVRLPGCFEMPIICRKLMGHPAVNAVVVLGYIERGETLHGEIMGHCVQQALIDLQLQTGKPVGIGIIGPGATLEQAEKRKLAYAKAAVAAAHHTLETLSRLDQIG